MNLEEFYHDEAVRYRKKYNDLLSKIHEKIESEQKEIDYLQNKDTLYISPLRRHEENIQILKSLLEGEKQ